MHFRLFYKKIYIIMLIILFSTLLPVSGGADDVNFQNLSGNWTLLYGNDYGYSFRFYKNYRAIVILYLSSSSIVFRGVYNIESSDTIRINISEMKRVESVKNIDLKGGFQKAKSSYFIFNTKVISGGGKRNLELRPQKISIDGNDSEGYFEPYIKLNYSGR
ncbi:MAG: hypothetical protein CVV49_14990 [Spirochaetae bacterium HGW-Spirochaetae-5]|nr:MAG: hypothetical protein CVV49_14990 [Spirochaetae bacterium HGW-Spirochaetae-5]